MAEAPTHTILCVDDEPRLLAGLRRTLGFEYQVETAESAKAALAILKSNPDVAVVISDLRMPEMDGIGFLGEALRVAPDTVRILLTGNADVASAVRAVNDGQLFRFLLKPCAPDPLRVAIAAAVAQHELITAERVLLEQTLRGAINLVGDTLAMVAPETFGRVTRLRALVGKVLAAVGFAMTWDIETASVLMHLPYISVPQQVLARYFKGEPLDAAEQQMIGRIPEMAEELISEIPRMERVHDILRHIPLRFDGQGTPEAEPIGEAIPLGSRALRLVGDFLTIEALESSSVKALVRLRTQWGIYDPTLGAALFKTLRRTETVEIQLVTLKELKVGMVILQPIETSNGTVILAEGHVASAKLIERLKNFAKGLGVREPIKVSINTSPPVTK